MAIRGYLVDLAFSAPSEPLWRRGSCSHPRKCRFVVSGLEPRPVLLSTGTAMVRGTCGWGGGLGGIEGEPDPGGCPSCGPWVLDKPRERQAPLLGAAVVEVEGYPVKGLCLVNARRC